MKTTMLPRRGTTTSGLLDLVEASREKVRAVWPDLALSNGQPGFIGGKLSVGNEARELCVYSSTGYAVDLENVAFLCGLMGDYATIANNTCGAALYDCYCNGALPVGLSGAIDVALADPVKHVGFVDGLIRACRLAGDFCRPVGWNVAERPLLFSSKWMANVTATAVGVGDEKIFTRNVRPGQKVFGWLARGFGISGLSMARVALRLGREAGSARRKLQSQASALHGVLYDSLLHPVPIHIGTIEDCRREGVVFSAHSLVAGGGISKCLSSVLPENCVARLRYSGWQRPEIFSLIQKGGKISHQEMQAAFGLGIIMVSIVEQGDERVFYNDVREIGEVVARKGEEPQVQFWV